MATTINSNTTDGLVITPDTSGEIELQANGTTKATVDANGITGEDLILTANNDGIVRNNTLTFHDTDTAVATGQSAGAIDWKQDGGTLGAGTIGRLECLAEGTGGSYAMRFFTGSVTGSGNGNEFTEQWRINSSGRLYAPNGSLFEGDIINMSVAELSNITTGNSAASYATVTYGGITQYVTTHTFNYGFTAQDSTKVCCIPMQQNSNGGGHISMYNPQISLRTTTGATLYMKDVTGSSNVAIEILCVEIA